jgi:hypothetical protein
MKEVIMSRRIVWAVGLIALGGAIAAGFTLMILSNNGTLAQQPWRPLGLAIATLSALTGFMLGLVEAVDTTSHPERHHRPT